jgi:antirestriction protein
MSPETDGEMQPSPETPEPASPRIYVASLSDYNAGRLHGAFIDAAQEADEIYAEIQIMVAKSPQPGAEEWAIHDYDGFHGLQLSEYESIEHVARIAQGIVEHGPAFAAWASQIGPSRWDEGLDQFSDCYRGEWDSLTAYAEELLDDIGADAALDGLGDWLRPYVRVDAEALARDLASDLSVAPSPAGGVYVFSSC